MRGSCARNVTLPRSMRDAVVEVAADRGVSFSDVLVAALDAYLPAVTAWEPIRLPHGYVQPVR